jgi:aminomethyltransferase
MVPFAGWEMPVHYPDGILKEHLAVRNAAGLFDVSHMGRVLVTGPDAEKFLDYIFTGKVAGRSDNLAIYGVLCNDAGGSIDDAIVYRQSANRCFIVVNAGNRDKDLQHLRTQAAAFDVQVTDRYNKDGILALQGPKADQVIQELFPTILSLKPMHFTEVNYRGFVFPVARTGYTGSGGYEFYPPLEALELLWKDLLKSGEPYGIKPIGLGARDTLRLEMGYALYGHELSDTIAPIESVAAWAVKMDKERFLGKDKLVALAKSNAKRYQYGAILTEKGIPREGYPVWLGDQKIGAVTSGTHSPSLTKGIALVMVDRSLNIGDQIKIQIRQNRIQAEIVALPFFQK